jgi:HPt (histidine-containing phosphotransfer) domain-containing protein
MHDRTISEPGTVDGPLICSASMTLGVSRLAELLVVFEARIERLAAALAALPDNLGDILATLHQSRGSAATLGLTELERVLADIERRLSPGADNAVCGLSGDLVPRMGVPSVSHQAVDAVGEAWRASLRAAFLHVPDLRHHRPFGSRK